jgi:hypothetical protein
MPDGVDHDPFEPECTAALEEQRIRFAAARVADHAERELSLLERATQVQDDRRARELEYQADVAYRDCIAITEEHGLDS